MQAQLKLIGLDEIDINQANPRKRMDEESLKELAASVASVGVIQPVVVTTRDGKNLLVTGERRVWAARMAGLKEIPAVVRDLTDKQILEAMLVENLQREDLAPLEQADALNRLIQEYDWTQQALAERIGRSQPWISKRIKLLGLPQEAQEALYSGRISIEDALELCRLSRWPDKILEALERPEWGMKSQVESLLRQHLRERAREEAYAKLRAQGKRVWKENYLSWFYPETELEACLLDEKQEAEHKEEGRKCLAYTLDWGRSPVPVCTDRAHWYDEIYGDHVEKAEREKLERKAKEKQKLESDYEMIRSITGGVEEIEAYMRREALNYATNAKTQKTAARIFGWREGRRLDTARLAQEIKKARRRELRRLWLVTVACQQISYGWGGSEVIQTISQVREETGAVG